MSTLKKLTGHLKPGNIYRRDELTEWSTNIDWHLKQLVRKSILQKLYHGIYYYPKKTIFGYTPPDERELITSFLRDHRFVMISFNAYNQLAVGTTQLYNHQIVYNYKRSGQFKLGNRTFDLRTKRSLPKKLTAEYLMVDLVNNLKSLEEDPDQVLKNISTKIKTMNRAKIKLAIRRFANPRAKKILIQFLK